MANLAAIRSVGASLERYLNDAYRIAVFPESVSKPTCTFTLATIGGLDDKKVKTETSAQVIFFLHRVGLNPHLRNSGYSSDRERRQLPVSLDLHYLFSFWASSADNESLLLAWTLRELQMVTLLDQSILTKEAGWTAEDVIQFIPEEISTDEMMRIWDGIQPDYRLSISYVAKVVRIDPDQEKLYRPVVAMRSTYAVPSGDNQ